jgi:hypothetical protein
MLIAILRRARHNIWRERKRAPYRQDIYHYKMSLPQSAQRLLNRGLMGRGPLTSSREKVPVVTGRFFCYVVKLW